MKRILTNNIVANVRKQRLPKSSLDHLMNAYTEGFQAILNALNCDPTEITILSGAVVTQDGQDFEVTAGWAAYQDEIFQVDAVSFTVPGGQTAVWVIETTYLGTDPVAFDDGNEFNVNEIRKLKLQAGLSGSGLKDFNDVAGRWVPATLATNVTGNLMCKKNIDGTISIRSVDLNLNGAAGGSNVFDLATLPAGFGPALGNGLSWIPIVARYNGTVHNYNISISGNTVSILDALTTEPGGNQANGNVHINEITFHPEEVVPPPEA